MRFIMLLAGFVFILSCKKDSVVEPATLDCLGESGGSASFDNCETCDADPDNDCVNCLSFCNTIPSSAQAFYYFQSVTIDGQAVDADDWVGAFNESICVGSRQWDTSLCGVGTCDLPVLGIDNNVDGTQDYCKIGDILTFRIYDVSEGIIYHTKTTEEIVPWSNLNSQIISTLESTTAAPCQ